MSSLFAIHTKDGVLIEPRGAMDHHWTDVSINLGMAHDAARWLDENKPDSAPHTVTEYRTVEPPHENADCPVCRNHIGHGHPCGFITDMNKGTKCGVNSPPGFIWCGGERHAGWNTTYLDREAIITTFEFGKKRFRVTKLVEFNGHPQRIYVEDGGKYKWDEEPWEWVDA